MIAFFEQKKGMLIIQVIKNVSEAGMWVWLVYCGTQEKGA
jgi:hypothetical protein